MRYFLDTNVISKIVNKDRQALKVLQKIAQNEESEIFINRLVYAESLRAIPYTHKKLYNKTKDTLESFEKLDITQDIYNKAIKYARFCKSKGFNFGKCEIIDYLHFITAKEYSLEIVSFDKDMEKLEELYMQYLEAMNN